MSLFFEMGLLSKAGKRLPSVSRIPRPACVIGLHADALTYVVQEKPATKKNVPLWIKRRFQEVAPTRQRPRLARLLGLAVGVAMTFAKDEQRVANRLQFADFACFAGKVLRHCLLWVLNEWLFH